MRLLQAINVYPRYLRHLEQSRSRSGSIQIDKAVLRDGFWGGHLLTPYVSSNSALVTPASPKSIRTVSARLRPDVIYRWNMGGLDSEIPKILGYSPLTVSWRAFTIRKGETWQGVDLALSSHSVCLEALRKAGAANVARFYPGFPKWIADAVSECDKRYDIVFTGIYSPGSHNHRLEVLHEVQREFGDHFEIFLYHNHDIGKLRVHKPVWGMDMYRTLRRAKIVLNLASEVGKGEAGNMRLFEATGVGSMLITDDADNLDRLFTAGKDVVTFSSTSDLIDKIRFYLKAEDLREEIAYSGQQRCLRSHTMQRRAAQFKYHVNRIR